MINDNLGPVDGSDGEFLGLAVALVREYAFLGGIRRAKQHGGGGHGRWPTGSVGALVRAAGFGRCHFYSAFAFVCKSTSSYIDANEWVWFSGDAALRSVSLSESNRINQRRGPCQADCV